MPTRPMSLVPAGAEPLREAALALFTALLGIAFLLLLAADQTRVVARGF